MNQVPRARPAGVTAVAALFLLYGIGMVVNASQNQGWTGWVEAGSLPRGTYRLRVVATRGKVRVVRTLYATRL